MTTSFPTPDDEAQRLRKLREYNVLDTPKSNSFDNLTELASKIFDMPIVLVSLVDENRLWFISRHGIDFEQAPREKGFCNEVVLSQDTVAVPNARKDPRTRDNSFVTQKDIGSYFGAPLKTDDNYVIGAFCVLDTTDRELSEKQLSQLQKFASETMEKLELVLTKESLDISGAQGNNQSNVRTRLSPDHDGNDMDDLVGVSKDITDRKQLEEELEQQRNLLELVVDRMPGVAFQFKVSADGQYEFPYLSRGFEELTGVPREAAKSSFEDAVSTIHPDDLEDVLKSINTAVDQVKPWEAESRFRLPDGSIKWIYGSSKPVEKPDGSIVFSGVLLDITQRKEAKQDLQEREEKFRQMAENIEEVFWMTNPEKDELYYVSPAYEDIWDASREELYESPEQWMESVIPEDRLKLTETFDGQVQDDFDIEYRIEPNPGEIRWIRSKGFPVEDEQGNVEKIVGVAEDITERKAIEEDLRDSLDQKDTLLTEVHHRVKNNLQVVSSLMNMQTRMTTSEESRKALRKTQDRVMALGLIHEKLYQSFDRTSVNLNTYFSELVSWIFSNHTSRSHVNYQIYVEDIALNLNYVIPCGLIIYEIVSHLLNELSSVSDPANLSIKFRVEEENYFVLEITLDDVDLENPFQGLSEESIAWTIVEIQAEGQLDGTLELETSDEPSATVRFQP
jgi:PAS domain S-box-containing protein